MCGEKGYWKWADSGEGDKGMRREGGKRDGEGEGRGEIEGNGWGKGQRREGQFMWSCREGSGRGRGERREIGKWEDAGRDIKE